MYQNEKLQASISNATRALCEILESNHTEHPERITEANTTFRMNAGIFTVIVRHSPAPEYMNPRPSHFTVENLEEFSKFWDFKAHGTFGRVTIDEYVRVVANLYKAPILGIYLELVNDFTSGDYTEEELIDIYRLSMAAAKNVFSHIGMTIEGCDPDVGPSVDSTPLSNTG